jgi:dihydrofolate reductase
VLALLDSTDTILIGRKLAVDYIPFWQDTLTRPDDPMHEVAQRIVRAKKLVFTSTLRESRWENTELVKGPLSEEVNRLKAQSGKDIVVYGGSSFVSSLIGEKLIDELHLFVNPVALGNGVPIFQQIEGVRQLKLMKSAVYPCGIALLQYEFK